MCDTNQPSGDQIIELADGKRIIINTGSGVIDLGDKLFSLPEFDPSLSSVRDPVTDELVVSRDGVEIARLTIDMEPPPGSGMTYLTKAMMAEHLDLSKCYDYNAPSIHAGDPSTFKGPLLPPGPLRIIEHHCPPDKDK